MAKVFESKWSGIFWYAFDATSALFSSVGRKAAPNQCGILDSDSVNLGSNPSSPVIHNRLKQQDNWHNANLEFAFSCRVCCRLFPFIFNAS